MTSFRAALVVAFLAPSTILWAQARRPLLLAISGVAVGTKSDDAAVVKRFGKGCFVDTEGHVGGRYFVDRRHSITLHVELGTDSIVEVLGVLAGVRLPASCRLEPAVSPGLTAPVQMQHGLRLGMAPKEVLARLGNPDATEVEQPRRTLIYKAETDSDNRVSLSYEARYVFESDVLREIVLYDGE